MLSVRRAVKDDCRLLWEWVNDAAARTAAFNSATIPWPDHVTWFQARLGSDRCFIYVAETGEGVPVGQVRFDVSEDGVAEVDLSLAAEWRGRGLAPEVLRLACDAVRQEAALTIVAHVSPENYASLRTFEHAGFNRIRPEYVGACESIRLEFPAPQAHGR